MAGMMGEIKVVVDSGDFDRVVDEVGAMLRRFDAERSAGLPDATLPVLGALALSASGSMRPVSRRRFLWPFGAK